ncbi:hypothetical protein K5549_022087, partial [Capra hircus]|uniref:Lipocalin/cytosolic fatty-acid binding domain-containing protein n=1 Tax=Capra hircus TaxID=9925 RepID=A0A452DPA8_CAPHI
MKALFLTLLLCLVCGAQEEEAEQSALELSGKWITVYLASTNPEKIAENGPFRIKFLKIEAGDAKNTIIFEFCIKRDGKWEIVRITGKKEDDNTYVFEYEGTTKFIVIYASD